MVAPCCLVFLVAGGEGFLFVRRMFCGSQGKLVSIQLIESIYRVHGLCL